MDDVVEKSIYENLIILRDNALHFKIEESERRKLITWAIDNYRTINKLFGRTSSISKECRNLIDTLRRREREFPLDLAKTIINKTINLAANLERLDKNKSIINISEPSLPPDTKNIFVIHGHDELNTHRLLNIVQNDFQLNPLAIFLKPGQSRSILEKFESNAATCSFAFALFSKDDEIIKSDERYLQARPNVIFDSDWFTGRLGKSRIVLLLQNGVKIHSDFDGISRIQFSNNIEEKYKEIKIELEASKLI